MKVGYISTLPHPQSRAFISHYSWAWWVLPGVTTTKITCTWKVLTTGGIQSKIFFPSLVCLSSLQNRKGRVHLYQRLWTLLHQVTFIKLNSGSNTGNLQRNWKTTWLALGLDETHSETSTQAPPNMSKRRNSLKLPVGELCCLAGCWVSCRCWGPQAGTKSNCPGERRHLQVCSLVLLPRSNSSSEQIFSVSHIQVQLFCPSPGKEKI